MKKGTQWREHSDGDSVRFVMAGRLSGGQRALGGTTVSVGGLIADLGRGHVGVLGMTLIAGGSAAAILGVAMLFSRTVIRVDRHLVTVRRGRRQDDAAGAALTEIERCEVAEARGRDWFVFLVLTDGSRRCLPVPFFDVADARLLADRMDAALQQMRTPTHYRE